MRTTPDLSSILVIIAHPDDEVTIAPFLGKHCAEGTSRCSFLVMTRGENGPCAFFGGCGDLGMLREQEMRAAATLFDATVRFLALPDVMENVEARWSAAVGGRESLLRQIRAVIDADRPTTIITYEPAHGTTCHPAHRAAGALAIEAAGAERVTVIETLAFLSGDSYTFANALPGADVHDAGTTWHYLVSAASIHASQFGPARLAAFQLTPFDQRRVYLAPAVHAGTHTVTCP